MTDSALALTGIGLIILAGLGAWAFETCFRTHERAFPAFWRNRA